MEKNVKNSGLSIINQSLTINFHELALLALLRFVKEIAPLISIMQTENDILS